MKIGRRTARHYSLHDTDTQYAGCGQHRLESMRGSHSRQSRRSPMGDAVLKLPTKTRSNVVIEPPVPMPRRPRASQQQPKVPAGRNALSLAQGSRSASGAGCVVERAPDAVVIADVADTAGISDDRVVPIICYPRRRALASPRLGHRTEKPRVATANAPPGVPAVSTASWVPTADRPDRVPSHVRRDRRGPCG